VDSNEYVRSRLDKDEVDWIIDVEAVPQQLIGQFRNAIKCIKFHEDQLNKLVQDSQVKSKTDRSDHLYGVEWAIDTAIGKTYFNDDGGLEYKGAPALEQLTSKNRSHKTVNSSKGTKRRGKRGGHAAPF